MFRDREAWRRRLDELIERFRIKGATSPEKAMTLRELGLPTRFEEAMHRRLGSSGIFVEVNGKYYLDEERLKQIRAEGGSGGSARPPTWFRIIGLVLMLPVGFIIALLLFYAVTSGGGVNYPGEFFVIFLFIFVALIVARLIFWRYRRRYWRERMPLED